MTNYLNRTSRLLSIRNYSRKTVDAYTSCLKEYFIYEKNNFSNLDVKSIENFILNRQELGYSSSAMNLYIVAIKFFYKEVLREKMEIDIKYQESFGLLILTTPG